MRIGLAEQTVLAALGQAAALSETLPSPPSKSQPSTEEVFSIYLFISGAIFYILVTWGHVLCLVWVKI